jgi:hypothetical protein
MYFPPPGIMACKHRDSFYLVKLTIWNESYEKWASQVVLRIFFLLHKVGVSAHIHVNIHPYLEWDQNSEPVVCAVKT